MSIIDSRERNAVVTNTLIDTGADLGDTVDVYVFDVGLARGLLVSSGVTLTASLMGLFVMTRFGGGGVAASVLTPVVLSVLALSAAWALLVAATRLRRRRDRFVVRRFGLAHHHDRIVTFTRWVDIAVVTHSGSNDGSRIARLSGTEYRCRIDLRDGGIRVFDNYVVDGAALGQEIERRSLTGSASS